MASRLSKEIYADFKSGISKRNLCILYKIPRTNLDSRLRSVENDIMCKERYGFSGFDYHATLCLLRANLFLEDLKKYRSVMSEDSFFFWLHSISGIGDASASHIIAVLKKEEQNECMVKI